MEHINTENKMDYFLLDLKTALAFMVEGKPVYYDCGNGQKVQLKDQMVPESWQGVAEVFFNRAFYGKAGEQK